MFVDQVDRSPFVRRFHPSEFSFGGAGAGQVDPQIGFVPVIALENVDVWRKVVPHVDDDAEAINFRNFRSHTQ